MHRVSKNRESWPFLGVPGVPGGHGDPRTPRGLCLGPGYRPARRCRATGRAGLALVALGLAGAGLLAQEADFDSRGSGFVGRTFVDGGVRFSENLWFPGGNQVQFAVTNGTGTLGGFSAFSAPNVMTTGSWSTGTTLGFTRTHQWIASIDQPARAGQVDLFWLARDSWRDTEVCLEGLVGDDVVVSDCFVHPGALGTQVQHTRLRIEGVAFERMRFICRGGISPGDRDGILAVFDNVRLEADEPCVADVDGDGQLSVFDFLAFQNLFDAGDPRADLDGDGQLTLLDFLAFQNAFDAGCP
ncbi:MAG: hypothetical protein KatS3mg103_1456 [Phycisphaerales bacterium]|nr:MAG: hypothetical protein KatS3mg103_1456 [Phycisphaerales bacterium]